MAGHAGDAAGVPQQLIRGQNFERNVLSEQGLIKNWGKVGNSIPDSMTGGVLTEIKDVQYLYKSSQFRDFLNTGKPVDLIVSPQTKISAPLYNSILDSGGSIWIRTAENVYVPYVK
jgi:hypothetical protein